MFIIKGHPQARLSLRALSAFAASCFIFAAPRPASAVVVHGVVTTPLGRPLPGARVQLVQGKRVIAAAVAGADGSYEIRSTESGRFVTLASSPSFYPGIGQDFYGGTTDIVTQDLVLETASVQQEVTVTATGTPTPIQQASSAVTLLPQSVLLNRVAIVDGLRQVPGVAVVQTGQAGGATSLFVRGGGSDANKVLIDGIPAEDVGGRFDFGTVSATAIGNPLTNTAIEVYRGPDSVLYGSDAAASVVALSTPRGTSSRPVLDYTGDAGNFHSYRNEVTLGGTKRRLDYFAAFSRFNTSNALPNDEYHVVTSAANFGYSLTANTQLRFTIRNAVSATGLPGPYDFYGVAANAKEADQDLYSGATLENRLSSGWHNLVRYGIARKREQSTTFAPSGTFLADAYGGDYYGKTVTIRGANGYTATGRAVLSYACYPQPDSCYPQSDYFAYNRDELYYQSDYVFPHRIAALFGFRYENERGSFVYPAYGENEPIRRPNYQYTLEFSGDVWNRLFYSFGGAVEKNHLYGVAGTPRFGVAYAPVCAGNGLFHGTRFRANASSGVQEPSLSVDYTSLYTQLQGMPGGAGLLQQYGVTPIRELRSRTIDVGLDQNIWSDKLVLKAGYFHNQFSHQIEYVDSGTLKTYFGITGYVPNFYGADLNSLAYRAQGIETEIEWRPTSRIFARGGYTYLDGVVEQSFSSDAIAARNGYASVNPNFPGIPIGESPFVGARPFRRPPHTGFFTVQYTGTKLTGILSGALASRSDDSTFLDYADLAGTNSLILPNRNLDFGYAKLDAGFTYAIKPRVMVLTQLDNLLNQQHIGPIGYPSLPLTVRAGLKVRLSSE